jgi:glycosyltransferase involved in cell wall biosynthesis
MAERPITLAYDASAVPGRPVGAGTYTIELARALAQQRGLRVVTIARRDDRARWEEISGADASVLALAPSHRVARLLFQEIGLSRSLNGRQIDVIHAPHYTVPRRARQPVVATVHDLTMVEHPEWHERTKAAYFAHAIAAAAKHAKVVICPSEYSAARFIERYAPVAQVRVIAHGIDHQHFSPTEPSPGSDRLALDAFGIPARYLCHLGTLEPRKNLLNLIAAFDRVALADEQIGLVLAGGRGWAMSRLDQAISASPHRDRIFTLGYVRDDVVPALLRNAAAVVYPSFEEGFGLPALEALACGAPLVTSRSSVMAELADDAAVLVDPLDQRDIAAGIAQVLGENDPKRRERAIARAARFSWQASADAHLEAYRAALGSL